MSSTIPAPPTDTPPGPPRFAMKVLHNSGETLYGWRVNPNPTRHSVADMKAHINSLVDLNIRDDDVLLATYPKSGTHWLWEVTKMLRQGKASYSTSKKVAVMLEFADLQSVEAEPSPRTLNSHLPMCHLPRGIKDKKIKIVHVARNPKDVLTSMFYHFGQINHQELKMADLMEKYVANQCNHAHQFDYLRQLQQYKHDNPDVPMATFYFEDMKKNPIKVTRELANFLDVDVSDDVVEEIVDACSFAKLKIAEANRSLPEKSTIQKVQKTGIKGPGGPRRHLNIYRKGEIGDWKNNLTVAQSEVMDDFIETESKGLDYNFTYI